MENENYRIDQSAADYILQLLNKRYYQANDLQELCHIERIYRQLGYKTDSWLSKISNINKKMEDK